MILLGSWKDSLKKFMFKLFFSIAIKVAQKKKMKNDAIKSFPLCIIFILLPFSLWFVEVIKTWNL